MAPHRIGRAPLSAQRGFFIFFLVVVVVVSVDADMSVLALPAGAVAAGLVLSFGTAIIAEGSAGVVVVVDDVVSVVVDGIGAVVDGAIVEAGGVVCAEAMPASASAPVMNRAIFIVLS